MNKKDLVNEVAKVVGTKRGAEDAVNCVLSSITKALKKKQSVTILGFGTFRVSQRKARKGRNPLTGQELKIKAKNAPKFIAGDVLKRSVSAGPLSCKLRRWGEQWPLSENWCL